MPTYVVTIADAAGTNGIGPVEAIGPTPADALRFAAAAEGRTLEQLGEAGLTVHTIREV